MAQRIVNAIDNSSEISDQIVSWIACISYHSESNDNIQNVEIPSESRNGMPRPEVDMEEKKDSMIVGRISVPGLLY